MSNKMNDMLDKLCQREEDYVQMNAALEAKSCALKLEAEQMMKLQGENLFTEPCDDNLPTDLKSFEDYPGNLSAQNSRPNTSKYANERNPGSSDHRITDMLLDLPPNIGSEAMVRLLKAKVHALQEEVEKFVEDNRRLMLENSSFTNNIKNLEDTNGRLQRAAVNHQQAADRMKQQLETVTSHGAQFEIECSALRKDIYSQEQKKVDELLVENRRLQKQKNDLMVAFKKQMKLIDILKRQKMHLEASKVLEFTEAEFLKAIDWKD